MLIDFLHHEMLTNSHRSDDAAPSTEPSTQPFDKALLRKQNMEILKQQHDQAQVIGPHAMTWIHPRLVICVCGHVCVERGAV